MKRPKLLNLMLLSLLFSLTACSNSQDKIKNKVSIYHIMGITEPQQNLASTVSISPNISYISYKKKPPKVSYLDHKRKEISNSIARAAKKFLGTPYVWGATGPHTFDCSGFTQWVYRDVGINIPRISRNQARVGQFVKYEDLQRGDMVFFDTKKKRSGRVTHVGIYLGNSNFIHASSSGKSVVIYNFNQKEFFKKRFLWGRRVIEPSSYYAVN